jgi:hypothetical protein
MPELDKVQPEEDLLFAFASTIAATLALGLADGGSDYLDLLLISPSVPPDIRLRIFGVGKACSFLRSRRSLPLAQAMRVRNAALVEREAVTLPLDHAFGFELADVGPAAIEVQRQRRRADGRGSIGDGRAINGNGLRHRIGPCWVAVG